MSTRASAIARLPGNNQTCMYDSNATCILQENYGIDWSGLIAESGENDITVPELITPITDDVVTQLQQYTLDRILSSDFYAVDLYCEIVEHVS